MPFLPCPPGKLLDILQDPLPVSFSLRSIAFPFSLWCPHLLCDPGQVPSAVKWGYVCEKPPSLKAYFEAQDNKYTLNALKVS